MEAPSSFTKKEHIHFGHLGTIIFCAVFLISIAFLKGGYKLFQSNKTIGKIQTATGQNSKAEKEKQFLKQSLTGKNSGSQDSEYYNQLSMIDPNFGEGDVLGLDTSTLENLDFPKIHEILTPDFFNSIPTTIIDDSSLEAIEDYKLEITSSELENQAAALLELLSQDNSPNMDQELVKVLEIFLKIPAPKVLEEYHKLNMLYYFLLVEAYKENSLPEDEQSTPGSDVMLVSVSQRIAEIKNQITSKYEIEL